MRLRATLRIRNNALLEARMKIGLSQIKCDEFCDVPAGSTANLEKLNFKIFGVEKIVTRMAGMLLLKPEEIVPESLRGEVLTTKFVSIADVNEWQLPMIKNLELESSRAEDLEKAVKTLSKREQMIISDRYALSKNQGKTLAGIAREMNLTPERVRQIERRALGKLAHPLQALQKLRNAP